MNEKIFLIPAPGVRVLDPDTLQPLPEEGASVSNSIHWQRRLREGDVTEGKPAQLKPATKAKE